MHHVAAHEMVQRRVAHGHGRHINRHPAPELNADRIMNQRPLRRARAAGGVHDHGYIIPPARRGGQRLERESSAMLKRLGKRQQPRRAAIFRKPRARGFKQLPFGGNPLVVIDHDQAADGILPARIIGGQRQVFHIRDHGHRRGIAQHFLHVMPGQVGLQRHAHGLGVHTGKINRRHLGAGEGDERHHIPRRHAMLRMMPPEIRDIFNLPVQPRIAYGAERRQIMPEAFPRARIQPHLIGPRAHGRALGIAIQRRGDDFAV